MKWAEWSTGQTNWSFGCLRPDEVLYAFQGPAIFTSKIGLDTYLFYKSDEHDDGDYFIAASVSPEELSALKAGKLSVRGALSQPKCWLMDVDLDLDVRRFEKCRLETISGFLPRRGVPLFGSFPTAADSIQQTNSLFAFKFFGDELSEAGMPFATFKGIVDNVYQVVRSALTPVSLSAGRDRSFLDFPVRQPQFASLLIAIDAPTVDVAALRARDRTKQLNPQQVEQDAQDRGRNFAEQVERTVDLAMSGRLTETYAADNYEFLQQIVDILPSNNGEISKMQFSSNSNGSDVFVEVDAKAGDKIRHSFYVIENKNIYISGVITGVLYKSKTFRLQTNFGREVTCQLGYTTFDKLLSEGRLSIGKSVGVSGRYIKRDYRDHMKVEGDPIFI